MTDTIEAARTRAVHPRGRTAAPGERLEVVPGIHAVVVAAGIAEVLEVEAAARAPGVVEGAMGVLPDVADGMRAIHGLERTGFAAVPSAVLVERDSAPPPLDAPDPHPLPVRGVRTRAGEARALPRIEVPITDEHRVRPDLIRDVVSGDQVVANRRVIFVAERNGGRTLRALRDVCGRVARKALALIAGARGGLLVEAKAGRVPLRHPAQIERGPAVVRLTKIELLVVTVAIPASDAREVHGIGGHELPGALVREAIRPIAVRTHTAVVDLGAPEGDAVTVVASTAKARHEAVVAAHLLVRTLFGEVIRPPTVRLRISRLHVEQAHVVAVAATAAEAVRQERGAAHDRGRTIRGPWHPVRRMDLGMKVCASRLGLVLEEVSGLRHQGEREQGGANNDTDVSELHGSQGLGVN